MLVHPLTHIRTHTDQEGEHDPQLEGNPVDQLGVPGTDFTVGVQPHRANSGCLISVA